MPIANVGYWMKINLKHSQIKGLVYSFDQKFVYLTCEGCN